MYYGLGPYPEDVTFEEDIVRQQTLESLSMMGLLSGMGNLGANKRQVNAWQRQQANMKKACDNKGGSWKGQAGYGSRELWGCTLNGKRLTTLQAIRKEARQAKQQERIEKRDARKECLQTGGKWYPKTQQCTYPLAPGITPDGPVTQPPPPSAPPPPTRKENRLQKQWERQQKTLQRICNNQGGQWTNQASPNSTETTWGCLIAGVLHRTANAIRKAGRTVKKDERLAKQEQKKIDRLTKQCSRKGGAFDAALMQCVMPSPDAPPDSGGQLQPPPPPPQDQQAPGCPDGYYYQNGYCYPEQQGGGTTRYDYQCPPGYEMSGSNCVPVGGCPTGYNLQPWDQNPVIMQCVPTFVADDEEDMPDYGPDYPTPIPMPPGGGPANWTNIDPEQDPYAVQPGYAPGPADWIDEGPPPASASAVAGPVGECNAAFQGMLPQSYPDQYGMMDVTKVVCPGTGQSVQSSIELEEMGTF